MQLDISFDGDVLVRNGSQAKVEIPRHGMFGSSHVPSQFVFNGLGRFDVPFGQQLFDKLVLKASCRLHVYQLRIMDIPLELTYYTSTLSRWYLPSPS